MKTRAALVTSFLVTALACVLIQCIVWYALAAYGARPTGNIGATPAILLIFGSPVVIAAAGYAAWVKAVHPRSFATYAFAFTGVVATVALGLLLALPVGCMAQPSNCL